MLYIHVSEKPFKMGQCSSASQNIAQKHSEIYHKMLEAESYAREKLDLFMDKYNKLPSLKYATAPEYLECYKMSCHALSEHDKAMREIFQYKKQLRDLYKVSDDDVEILKKKYEVNIKSFYDILQEDSPNIAKNIIQ